MLDTARSRFNAYKLHDMETSKIDDDDILCVYASPTATIICPYIRHAEWHPLSLSWEIDPQQPCEIYLPTTGAPDHRDYFIVYTPYDEVPSYDIIDEALGCSPRHDLQHEARRFFRYMGGAMYRWSLVCEESEYPILDMWVRGRPLFLCQSADIQGMLEAITEAIGEIW